MNIILQRIYDEEQKSGYRVLVDRIWARGITREKANLNEWCKELAPSTELRKWFSHDPKKWESFRVKYKKELADKRDEAKELLKRAGNKTLILLYGARDTEHTHAIVLKEFLEHV